MRSLAYVLALGAVACVGQPALADTAPDKSQFSLFNPTPDDQLRDFNTDRPTKVFAPITVDAGHFQVETDLGIYTFQDNKNTRIQTRNYTAFDPLFRLGLTNNTEAQVYLTSIYTTTRTKDKNARTTSTVDGFGDVITRLKVNLFGNDGGDALAVMPYVKIPTNSRGVGNNQVEGGLIVPFSTSLPSDFTLTVQAEADAFANVRDNGKHANLAGIINVGHAITDSITAYGELFADVSTENHTGSFYTFDLAAAWVVIPNLQLDAGVNLGLNAAAPDVQAYIGVSKRF